MSKRKKYLHLTSRDIKRGQKILDMEKMPVLSVRSIFQATVYTILAQREQFKNQVSMYNNLLSNHLLDPRSCLDHPIMLRSILKTISLNTAKFYYILANAQIYNEVGYTLVEQIVGNMLNRDSQRRMRLKLVSMLPGISYKSASLILLKCGYEQLGVIDVWTLRYLNIYDVDSIYSIKRYEQIERQMLRLAKGYKMSLGMFQATIWGKLSSYTGAEVVDKKICQKLIKDY